MTSGHHRVMDPPSNNTATITKVVNTIESCQEKKVRAASTHDAGKERRWLNPRKGIVKVVEREFPMDLVVSRFLYPHMLRVWNPYSWLLERRFFSVAEISISPARWPKKIHHW